MNSFLTWWTALWLETEVKGSQSSELGAEKALPGGRRGTRYHFMQADTMHAVPSYAETYGEPAGLSDHAPDGIKWPGPVQSLKQKEDRMSDARSKRYSMETHFSPYRQYSRLHTYIYILHIYIYFCICCL